jgi:hypothetical protein
MARSKRVHFQGAAAREQGQIFAAVVVKRHVLDNRVEAAAAASFAGVITRSARDGDCHERNLR